jgi:hypothetical protein
MRAFLSLLMCVALAQAESTQDVGLEQICIWLPIGLVLVTIYAVYLMLTMDYSKDSLLYAKYTVPERQVR